jgi:hypothetical protein
VDFTHCYHQSLVVFSPATSIHNGLLVSGFLKNPLVDALSMHKTPLALDLGFVF